MKVAHGIYVSSEVAVSPPYDRALREFYHSKVEHMDFRNADKDQTLGLINEFVDEVTEGLIPRILEAAPQTEAKLVVVDGMALSARWLFPFDPKRTFDKGLFFLPEDQR
jgi:serine protease inhibitor